MAMRLLFVFLMVFGLGFSQSRISYSTFVTKDNQYQTSIRSYMGMVRGFEIKRADTAKRIIPVEAGASLGDRLYYFEGMASTFTDFRLGAKASPMARMKVEAGASFLLSGNWNVFVYDGVVSYAFRKSSIEVFSESELLGTPAANSQRLISRFNGVSYDFKISRRMGMVASLATNSITDGNSRYFRSLRTIYYFNKDSYVDLRTRYMSGGFHSDYYFSPSELGQLGLGYGLYKEMEKGYWRMYASGGIQCVNGYYSPMVSLDFRISKPVKRKNIEFSFEVKNIGEYVYGTAGIRILIDLKK